MLESSRTVADLRLAQGRISAGERSAPFGQEGLRQTGMVSDLRQGNSGTQAANAGAAHGPNPLPGSMEHDDNRNDIRTEKGMNPDDMPSFDLLETPENIPNRTPETIWHDVLPHRVGETDQPTPPINETQIESTRGGGWFGIQHPEAA